MTYNILHWQQRKAEQIRAEQSRADLPLHLFRVSPDSPCASPASLASPRPTHQAVSRSVSLGPAHSVTLRIPPRFALRTRRDWRAEGSGRAANLSARSSSILNESLFEFPRNSKSASGRPARSPSRLRTAVTAGGSHGAPQRAGGGLPKRGGFLKRGRRGTCARQIAAVRRPARLARVPGGVPAGCSERGGVRFF